MSKSKKADPKVDLFVDTSGWACYLDREDEFHAEVTELVREVLQDRHQRLITTNYVIAELVPLLTTHTRLLREDVIARINEILANGKIEIIHINQAIHQAAWQLLEKRRDKKWSLVDASSFVIMENLELTDAITTDHHFEQAGFERVPKLIRGHR